MKRILFINYSLAMGGIETLILEISKNMNKGRFTASVCVFTNQGTLNTEFEQNGIRVHIIEKSLGVDWTLPFKVARLARRENIDILHTHNSTGWLYGGLAAVVARIPLVHTEHTSPAHHFRLWWVLERALSLTTRKITAVSESVARFMIEREHIDAKKVQVIYNGIEANTYNNGQDRNVLRSELGIKGHGPVVGMIARLFAQKDHHTLLISFKKVLKHIPDATLLIIGDGPLRTELEDLKQELKLQNNVLFLGNRRDIPSILQTLDLFVLSTHKEGLPIVLLEAMAAGKPVVATAVDGNPELVQNRRTGRTVPPRDSEALKDAICDVLSNPSLAKEMGQKGRERVQDHFTIEKMIASYEDIYTSLGKEK